MSLSPERNIANDLPTIEQLRQLAAIGIDSGKERQRLQRHKKLGDYYMLDVLESDIELGDDTDGLRSMRHTVGMRLGERKGCDGIISNLKYYDSLHLPVQSREPQRPAISTVRYEFEWNDNKVHLARRIGKIVSVDSFGTLVDKLYSIRPDYGADEAQIIDAETGFQCVSDEEVSALTAEVADYYAKVSQIS